MRLENGEFQEAVHASPLNAFQSDWLINLNKDGYDRSWMKDRF